MSTIFEELAKQWDDLDDRQRAYLATTIAGTRQQNVFLTLMNDMAKAGEGASRVYQLYAGALESSGSVTEKYSVYQESVAATMDGLNAKWQEFINLFNGGGVFKTFYSGIGKLIDILTAGTKATDGWNLVWVGVGATLLVIIGLIPKIVAGIHAIANALNIANVATSKTKIGLIISSLIALGGVIATVVAGTKDLNSEREKIDYDSEINDIKNNVSSLKSLANEYETLAGKTNKSTEEYQRMDSIIEEIKGKAPAYADALTAAQGSITESIEITNRALEDQERMIRDLEVTKASQQLRDSESLASWKSAYMDYYSGPQSIEKLNRDYLGIDGEYKSFSFDGYESAEEWASHLISEAVRLNTRDRTSLTTALDKLIELTGVGYKTNGFISESNREEFEGLYREWRLGRLNSATNVLENTKNETTNTIAQLLVSSMQNSQAYQDLSEAQKKEVQKKVSEQIDSQIASQGVQDLGSIIENVQYNWEDIVQSVATS